MHRIISNSPNTSTGKSNQNSGGESNFLSSFWRCPSFKRWQASKVGHVHIVILLGMLVLISSLVLPSMSMAAKLTLAWDANDPAPDGYRVFKRTEGQSYDYNTPAWEGTGTTCSIDQLTNNTYYFVVCAYSGAIESSASNEVAYTIFVNEAPQAIAGSDMGVDELTMVTMDGSGSYDSDGNITGYQWSQIEGPAVVLNNDASVNPSFIAPDVIDNTALIFELTVSDNAGMSSTDTCTVTILPVVPLDSDGDGITDADEVNLYGTDPYNSDTDGDGYPDGEEVNNGTDPTVDDTTPDPEPQQYTHLWLEAEDGDIYSPMEIADDSQASEESYVWVPNNAGSGGYTEYTFDIDQAGDYVIWGRVIANDSRQDSFIVSVDGDSDLVWHTKQSGQDTWGWDVVSQRHYSDLRDPTDPVIYSFEAGTHRLVIKQRERGARLDRILVTNDLAYVPENMGEQPLPQISKLWLEAEAGVHSMPMQVGNDAEASDGSYAWVPNNAGSGGYTEYTFDIDQAGDYVIWGRVIANDNRQDSFIVSVDGDSDLVWHTKQSGQDTWGWDVVSQRHHSDLRDPTDPVIYSFEAGTHRLVIKQRERGTKIDKILIVNDKDFLPVD